VYCIAIGGGVGVCKIWGGGLFNYLFDSRGGDVIDHSFVNSMWPVAKYGNGNLFHTAINLLHQEVKALQAFFSRV
jgi:hypothetical protein